MVKINNYDFVLMLCTFPNIDTAENLSIDILNKQISCCITIIPNVLSLYTWKEKIERKNEVQMLLKTSIVNQQILFEYIKSNHPYKTPELLTLPIFNGDKEYFTWLKSPLLYTNN